MATSWRQKQKKLMGVSTSPIPEAEEDPEEAEEAEEDSEGLEIAKDNPRTKIEIEVSPGIVVSPDRHVLMLVKFSSRTVTSVELTTRGVTAQRLERPVSSAARLVTLQSAAGRHRISKEDNNNAEDPHNQDMVQTQSQWKLHTLK